MDLSKAYKTEKIKSVCISIVLLVIGYTISLFTCDDIFPRFGALVVCVGIIFSLKGYQQKLDVVLPIALKQMDEVKKAVDESSYQNDENNEAKNKFVHEMKPHIEAAENKIKRSVNEVKSDLLKFEGGLIIIGTLVWAFGDLIVTVNLFSTCSCI